MCYIKGTGAGRTEKFMLLKGNKVKMTERHGVGTFTRVLVRGICVCIQFTCLKVASAGK